MMMKIADAMPEEKFSYKSTAAQRDYGQQILHVAGGNIIYLQFMGAKAAAPSINRNATGKAEILRALADAYDYGTAVIKEQTDPVDAADGGDEPVPRHIVPCTRDLFPASATRGTFTVRWPSTCG